MAKRKMDRAAFPDPKTKEQRSRNMARIRSKDTRPEILVRRGLFERGYRYRLHDSNLPGKPDIVMAKYRATVFINGCFWHGHDCTRFRWPRNNASYWREKINRNRNRDATGNAALMASGWRVLTVWECAILGNRSVEDKSILDDIENWLVSGSKQGELSG